MSAIPAATVPLIEEPRESTLLPRLNFPADAALPALQQFIDPDWVLPAIQEMSVAEAEGYEPARVRLRHFVHNPGRSALVSYEVEWEQEAYLPPDHFVFKVAKGQESERFRYPEDPRLPGLAAVAEPDSALRIINRHVLQFPTKTVRLEPYESALSAGVSGGVAPPTQIRGSAFTRG